VTGRRTGRRPGDHAAREDILRAARRAFGERGFAGATIRAIAADAGVDPALVLHYHRTKADLFAAAVRLPLSPSESFAALEPVGLDDLGESVLRLVLAIWEDPDALDAWLGLIRSATTDHAAATMLRDLVTNVVVERTGDLLRLDDAAVAYRVSLVGSQIVGLGLARHVLRLEPLASASTSDLVSAVAPTLQRYLTGALR
jgi:AcrR family transcriptional regulator